MQETKGKSICVCYLRPVSQSEGARRLQPTFLVIAFRQMPTIWFHGNLTCLCCASEDLRSNAVCLIEASLVQKQKCATLMILHTVKWSCSDIAGEHAEPCSLSQTLLIKSLLHFQLCCAMMVALEHRMASVNAFCSLRLMCSTCVSYCQQVY